MRKQNMRVRMASQTEKLDGKREMIHPLSTLSVQPLRTKPGATSYRILGLLLRDVWTSKRLSLEFSYCHRTDRIILFSARAYRIVKSVLSYLELRQGLKEIGREDIVSSISFNTASFEVVSRSTALIKFARLLIRENSRRPAFVGRKVS